MQVFKPGTEAKLVHPDAEMQIVSILEVNIALNHVTYNVVWFNGNTRTTAWVQSFELEPVAGQPKLPIGYK